MSGQFVPVLEVKRSKKKMLCFKIIGLSLPAGNFIEKVGNIFFFFYIFMMLINKSTWILSNKPIII